MTAGNLAAAEWECVAALEYARTTPLAMPALIRPLLGEVYLREGRNRDALAIFLSLYPNYSGNTPTELNIAIAYARLGDYRNALKFYKEAQQRDPHLWEYRAGGRDARAQDWPGTASLNAIQASAFLARAVGRNGWYDEELCDLQTAERLAPHNALIAYLAGQVLHSMHRLQEAQAYFHRAAREGSGPVAADAGKQANAVQWWMDYQRSQPTLKPGG